MKLVVYARTSTRNGASSDSLGAQEQACRDWAAANGHEVVAAYRDDGLSGALGVDQRPGLAAALLALEDGGADGLVLQSSRSPRARAARPGSGARARLGDRPARRGVRGGRGLDPAR